MKINGYKSGEVDVLELEGRFDAHTLADVENWLQASANRENPKLLIDMAGVRFIDSAGLAMLVRGMKWCTQQSGSLVLCSLQQPVRIIFEMTRLDKALSIHPDAQAALKTLTGSEASG